MFRTEINLTVGITSYSRGMDPEGQSGQQDREALTPLPLLEPSKPHKFITPVKKINEGQDVPRFLTSRAYVDICKFIMQLNISMCPRKLEVDDAEQVKTWELGNPDIVFSKAVQKLQIILQKIDGITDEVPPDTGPRRFGNTSFRKWFELLESRVPDLLKEHFPAGIVDDESNGEVTARDELSAYLLGSFGSAQRLDYGTGHELSFLAFLGCVWKLGGFQIENANQSTSEIGRSVVLGIIEP
jgi:serine/threonine-protein phosphatase 2A activator